MQEKSNFSINLSRLCRNFRSIAEICRELDVNRQQFNKYISGTVRPSAFNLQKILDFFEINEDVMNLPPNKFIESLHSRKSKSGANDFSDNIFGNIENSNNESMDRHLGYYFVYHKSPSFPKRIFRSITHFFRVGDLVFSKGLERFVAAERPALPITVSKERGRVDYADDRIYIYEYSQYIHKSRSLVILYPTYRPRPNLLCGVFVSVSSGAGRQPFSSRVVYEYMGLTPNLRSMISLAGLYPEDSTGICEEIRRKCQNAREEEILRAIDY
jgi:transcriptional regulator with XRE-family HTH domain